MTSLADLRTAYTEATAIYLAAKEKMEAARTALDAELVAQNAHRIGSIITLAGSGQLLRIDRVTASAGRVLGWGPVKTQAGHWSVRSKAVELGS